MTTGRINQVTIVHRSAEAQRPNPRRGGLYQEGGIAEAIPIAYRESAQGAIAAGDLFICPH